MSIDDDFDYEERLAAAGVASAEAQQNPIAGSYGIPSPDAEPDVPVGNGREDRPGSGSVSR